MSKNWLLVVIITVVVLIAWSGWSIYQLTQPKTAEAVIVVTPISTQFNTEVVEAVANKENNIVVKNEEIQPKTE